MIAHVDNRITYNGNGNATEFAYQFKILDRTDIKVLLTDADGKEKLLTKDYYVDVEKNVVRYPGYAVGAEVPESERPPVLPTGWKLTIYREVPVTQETDLPDQYPFNQVEAIGDKLTMIAQQLTDVTSRSLKISVSKSADIDTAIPWENGKSFRISDDGKTLELSEDPAKVLPLAQGVYAQTQAQAQSAAASATAAAKSEDSAFESAGVAGNSAQYASLSAASAAENAELTSGYKQEALTAKADATASATNAKESEANAKISENNAEASKEAAQSAANSASNFATDARSSANEAKSYRDAASTYATNAKNYSENVNVFVPSVSAEGVLSWSNKAGLTNPPSVNIKGKDGADGGVTVDAALSDSSTNPVQNKVINEALNNRAVLDDTNTFTSPNRFDDIYMQNGINSLKWYDGSPNFVVASINSKKYTGEAATARKATQDGAGNVITDTYTKKVDFDKTISELGVAFQQKADKSDLADVATSGKYTDLLNRPAYVVQSVNNVRPDSNGNVTITVSGGSNVTVDTTLSATSTNAIANKAVYDALDKKLDKTGTVYEATKATQDGYGNVITSTYVKKVDLVSYVKTVNNIAPDANGNVNVSGGSSNITIDTTLSATSTNPIANKTVYSALEGKLGKTETAYAATKATQDNAGNVITETYAKKADVSNTYATKSDVEVELNNKLNITGTAVAAQVATKALQDGNGNTISSTYVKSINNVTPDTNGNVTITTSGGGDSGVSLSAQNKWTAQQTFDTALLEREKYVTAYDSGTSITPIQATAWYTATGNFTLYLTTATYLLNIGQSQILTVYIKSSADYALTLKGAGTIKYIGAASDLAITSAGLLLNILMMSDGSGSITSIVQASKLS